MCVEGRIEVEKVGDRDVIGTGMSLKKKKGMNFKVVKKMLAISTSCQVDEQNGKLGRISSICYRMETYEYKVKFLNI